MVLAGSSQVRCIMNTIPVEICEYREIHDTAGMCFPFCVFLYVAKGSLSVSFGAEPLMLEHSDLVFLPPGRSLSCSSQGSRILLLGLSDSFVDDHLNVEKYRLACIITQGRIFFNAAFFRFCRIIKCLQMQHAYGKL